MKIKFDFQWSSNVSYSYIDKSLQRQKKTRNTHQCKCSWNGDAIKIFEKRNIVILGAKFGNAYVFSPDRHNCILGAVGAWAGLCKTFLENWDSKAPSVGLFRN